MFAMPFDSRFMHVHWSFGAALGRAWFDRPATLWTWVGSVGASVVP